MPGVRYAACPEKASLSDCPDASDEAKKVLGAAALD